MLHAGLVQLEQHHLSLAVLETRLKDAINNGRYRGQAFTKQAAAIDLLLGRIGFVQRQARRTGQLPGRFFDDDAELLAQHPRIRARLVHCCAAHS